MNIKWDYHIHTEHTDGNNSVEQIVKKCLDLGISEIAITEHVRKSLSYDFDQLLNEIYISQKKYQVKIWCGAEAKILPSGEIDISNKIAKKIDLLICSVHSWPKNISLDKAYKLISKSNCHIIGHPKYINQYIIKCAIKGNKAIEISYKYKPSFQALKLLRNYPDLKISFGSDAHNLKDILEANKYFSHNVAKYFKQDQIFRIHNEKQII